MPLVEPDDLPADLRAQWDATDRHGLRTFIQLMAHAPDQFRRYNETYAALRFDNQLGARTTELVRIAVASTTQCQVCMAGRHASALADGMTEDMVEAIPDLRGAGYDEADDAAVTFARKLASDHHSIERADLDRLAEHFSPAQIVELALLTVMCLVGRFSNVVGLTEDPL